jgi:hypothetical protein
MKMRGPVTGRFVDRDDPVPARRREANWRKYSSRPAKSVLI